MKNVAPHSVAFITPSFHGDFERCELLCKTTRLFLPASIEHLLLIDNQDVPLFKSLAGGPVRIVVTEDLLPSRKIRMPWSKFLPSLPSPQIRGWIWQQLCKMAATECSDAQVLHFLDSDVALTKPFDPAKLFDAQGRTRLQRTSFTNDMNDKWHRIAFKLLGIESYEKRANYVGNFITWKRNHLLDLRQQIEKVSGVAWHEAIARNITFSEYTLYGIYCDSLPASQTSDFFNDSAENLHMTWELKNEPAAIARFLDELKPSHDGIMIHSKLGVPLSAYKPWVEKLLEDRTAPENAAARAAIRH